jgi:pyrroline-5-carboxylate reductase
MPKTAFIGAGRMASAIVAGLLDQHVAAPADLACLGGDDDTARQLVARTGIRLCADLPALLDGADLVVLAFKPQHLADADPRLAALTAGKLVLSILAGKPLAALAKVFPQARNLIRTMPNTPGQIGAGITGWCSREPLSAEDTALVESLLGALGRHVAVDESQIDAITAVSGSGPAYVFEFTAALRAAGIAAGLTPEAAHDLALATVIGSAKLMQQTGTEPEELRNQVTSPNGTTYAGLEVMRAKDFRGLIRDTVLAAKKRSEELSRD